MMIMPDNYWGSSKQWSVCVFSRDWSNCVVSELWRGARTTSKTGFVLLLFTILLLGIPQ